jgi:protocatechuate 3,4-dioxygenase beta subunit
MTAMPNRRAVVTAVGAGMLAAGCARRDRSPAAGPESTTRERSQPTPDCVLTPEGTEGPYYVEDALVRSDIRDGREGVPLQLSMTVVDAGSCTLLPDALVDVWHSDAHGDYSTAESAGWFLRGIQRTDSSGVVAFSTIYPGWYDDRTVHIHAKVHLGGDVIHTGQLYFADEVTAAVAGATPYADRQGTRTDNEGDFLFRADRDRPMTLSGNPSNGYRGEVTLGVTP